MSHFEQESEAEIIKRIRAGEIVLYEILVRRLNPYLYKIGRSYNFNHHDTQDLMQDTFIDAYRNLFQFEGRSDFKTWIFRIMTNNCYKKKERASFKKEFMQDIDDVSKPIFSNGNGGTAEVVQNRELGRIIENALFSIPLNYRIVFSLREINGLSVSQTADLLNISDANVKVRLNRAKAMLKREIEKKYSPGELFEFNLIYCDPMVDDVMEKIMKI